MLVETVTHVSLKKHYFAEQFCVSGIRDKIFIAIFFFLSSFNIPKFAARFFSFKTF